MDIKNSPTLAYHTKSSVVLKDISPSELYYFYSAVLWPVENRDFICYIMVKQNQQTKVVTVDAPCTGDYFSENRNHRVKQSVGKWMLTPVAVDKVKIKYSLILNPRGSVPALTIIMG